MTPKEEVLFKSLVAVAWADGRMKEPEKGVLEGLLWAFGASEDDERELLAYAKKRRSLKDDIPVDQLDDSDRELLLAHAALLTHADGKQTKGEEKAIANLVDLLGLEAGSAKKIIAEARQRAAKLASRL